MAIYVVKSGDSVDSIAASAGVPVEKILWANQIEYPYRLAVGQAIYLPENGTAANGRTELYFFGYAYPFINLEVLADTLPFLTALYVFSYGFTMEGELISPRTDDTWLITAANEAGVRPVLVLTPLDAEGHFNNELVTAVVENSWVQERLIWNLGRTMQEKGYGGLDIDFEYVQAKDREGFAEFVSRIRQVMNLFGYPVSVALAPKTSADQAGLLYEGMDYGLLGEAADRVLLMTYEWGFAYGPPMAVAPINMVRRVVGYAVTEIPVEKISLGIPNYGYDWPLPYERGTTKAESISNLEAVKRAIDFGVEIRFDEIAQSPYYRYWQYGVQHEVWFEDVRSIKAKYDLIREYGLTGAGFWQLMNFFRPAWLLMEEMFRILR
ncbi:MAG: glycosyl hydrolase family 18 protein [Lachnospiraceae bacterium]|nr:glycosyl hydrolase family 18 protein [Lachnospiraceae bacterium]